MPLSLVCQNCGRDYTRNRGNEGAGRYCSQKCARARQPRASAEERFWRRVKKGDGCWEWQGGRDINHLYGRVDVYDGPTRRRLTAHRYGWELTNGPIAPGVNILHKCDNPPCVRPDHLYEGSLADNVRDREERHRRIAPHGSEHRLAKLTDARCAELRIRYANGESPGSIARSFGVSRTAVKNVLEGKTWRHTATGSLTPSNAATAAASSS